MKRAKRAKKASAVINAPKANEGTAAAQAINKWAQVAQKVDGLTPFGHKANTQGGLCDMAVIEGKVTTAYSLLSYLYNSKAPAVNKVKAAYTTPKGVNTAAVYAHFARRLQGHIKWCGDTHNNAHGGFISRLAKVGLASEHKAIAAHFAAIAEGLPLFTTEEKATLVLHKAQAK